jgi:lipoprotein-releasing system permease protein
MGMYTNFDSDIQITAAVGKTFRADEIDSANIFSIPGIEQSSFVLEENVLLKYGDRQNLAAIKGVDKNFISLTGLDSSMVAGTLLLESGDTNYTVVGQGIGYQLSVDPNDLFEGLHIYVPTREEVDLLNPTSAFSRAIILPVGVFSVQEEVDNKYIITPLRFLHSLLNRPGEYSSVEIKIAKQSNSKQLQQLLQERLGNTFIVKNRFEQREAFYKVMKSEKLISYFILFFILLIAAGNTIGSLYILVIEKKKDLKLLSSLGFTGAQARAVFTWQGLILAFIGGCLGLLIGSAICYFQAEYGLIKLNGADSFVFNAYPVELRWDDVCIVFITVLFLGFITSIYPAYKAKQIIE